MTTAYHPSESANPSPGMASFRFRRLFFPLISLLLLLSLWPIHSYHPADIDYLLGGIVSNAYPRNLLGIFGASLAWFMLVTFGLASYPIVLLSLICSCRRLFWRHGLRPMSWEYACALVLFAFGCSMLLGIWQNAFSTITEALNIATIPGGVLGQRFCAPGQGWLRLLLNPTGSAIAASIMIAVSLAVLWFFDWQLLFSSLLLEKLQAARKPVEETSGPTPAPMTPPAPRPTMPEPHRPEPLPAPAELPRATPREPAPAVQTPQHSASPVTRKTKAATNIYVLPGMDLLDADADAKHSGANAREIERNKAILQGTLDNFKIEATVLNTVSGPQVTLFEISPAPGVHVNRISNLENNIRMDLQAPSVRILAPIPGKNLVGIEVPNQIRTVVTVRNLMQNKLWEMAKEQIPLLLGKNISGRTIILDLARAPHLLIAGATGSGKSVCMNLLITSMLYRFRPDELKLIMVDPKVVEFQVYHDLPHLIVPVITDVSKVALALRWAINEMERRYRVLAKAGVRDLPSFNRRAIPAETVLDDEGQPIPDKLPYIVIIIDELADIMLAAKTEVEQGLAKIAAKSRAVGIHTIIATQRPDVKTITGTIKANYPVRIAFQVSSYTDARTILDGKGAETLLGQGDMLFKPPGAPAIERIQGGMASDAERDRVVGFVCQQASPQFDDNVFRSVEKEDDAATANQPALPGLLGDSGQDQSSEDAMVRKAIDIILRDRRPTISFLQRSLGIGYNKAASLMDELERRGVVGPQIGSSLREILIVAPEDLDQDIADDDQDPNDQDQEQEQKQEQGNGSARRSS
ncbi:MAG: DNA translocase FtsK 4TM domain-containing protein [Lentisphaeria bacterium]|nr:DNA translocase FtsK 4TM domain-containing protein [Lentisphaeria bacterium]